MSQIAQTIGFYGYIFTFPLGFIGHTCSLLTFLSTSLRHTSTGFLFIFLTISDILYLLISIYDFIKQVLQISINQNEYMCRFRTFILNFSTVTSAWILVFISIDRLLYTYSLCQQLYINTRRIFIWSIIIMSICSIVFTSHVFQTEFAFMFSTNNLCGPSRFSSTYYSYFYFNIWPILQLLITYFIPNCLMIICVIYIYLKLRIQRILIQISKRQEKLQQQMFILMITSIIYFSICTIPYSIHRIILFRSEANSSTLIEIAILTIFLDMNYSYNFYIHCLTSKLFRRKFIKQLKNLFLCWKRQTTIIYPLEIMQK